MRKSSDGWTDRDRWPDRHWRTDRQMEDSDFIGCCPTNVEHPKVKSIFHASEKIMFFSQYYYFLLFWLPYFATTKFVMPLWISFFNYYLVVPQPTLGQFQGDCLTNLKLITFSFLFEWMSTRSLMLSFSP